MSTLEQRRNGKRAGGVGPSASPARDQQRTTMPVASPRNTPMQRPSSSDEEEESEAEGPPTDDEEYSSSRAPVSRRGRAAAKLSSGISFVQTLVFVAVMMQALSLFWIYHMHLERQQTHSHVQTIAQDLARVQASVNRFVEGGMSQDAFAPLTEQDDDSDAEDEMLVDEFEMMPDNETDAEATETEGVPAEVDATSEEEVVEESTEAEEATEEPPQWTNADGSVDAAALDALIDEIEGARPGASSNNHASSGSHNRMKLRPADLEQLHRFRNWADDAEGNPVDGGATHNATHALMRKVGQLSLTGPLVWRDVKVLEHVRDDRTVVAARKFKKGDYFFKIHQDFLLTSVVVENSDIGQALEEAGIDQDDMLWLSVLLLFEKQRPDSEFKTWINTLPTMYEHMPSTFEQEELDLIEGTWAAQLVARYQEKYREEYVQLAHSLREFDFGQFSFAQFVWARCAVTSRAFGLNVNQSKMVVGTTKSALMADPHANVEELVHITCMSPADLVNHEGENRKISSLWGWNEKTRQMAFKATRDIAAGEELKTTYGPRANTDLFSHYGFALPSNPYNTARVCMAAHKGDFGFAPKQSLLKDIFTSGVREEHWDACHLLPTSTATGYSCRLHLDFQNEATHECLAFARIAQADAEEFEELSTHHAKDLEALADGSSSGDKDSIKWSVLELDPISYENEVKAIRMLAEFAQQAANEIVGGPAKNDAILLERNAHAKAVGQCSASADPSQFFPTGACLSPNQYNLILVRHGEKVVLEQSIELGRQVRAFHAEQPESIEASYAFLSRFVLDPKALASLASQDITPPTAILRFFNEHLLTLYFQARGFDVSLDGTGKPASEDARDNLRFYEQYRSEYRIYLQELREDEDQGNSFEFTQA